jgi:transposase
MFEELGITEVIDKATQQDPAMRIVTVGHTVKAMVLNGLGFVNQQLYLVPHFFQNKPLPRLIAPGIEASHLNDDTLGRALDTLYVYGVTELYSLIAATAARRLGLTPTCAHLDTTSFHTPSDFVVDQEASNAESGLYRESLLLDNVWTTFFRLIRDPITLIISMACNFRVEPVVTHPAPPQTRT